MKTFFLDEKYSTTELLTKENPEIINHAEDKFKTILLLPEDKGRQDEGGLRIKGCFKKSYKDKPLISIITVVFNGEKYLEQTIQSVINQSYNNVEYIIIDGGSTDETVDIIKKYQAKIDYWVSEKDNGIYDAMNKGVRLSTGEVVGIINADDYYEKDIFKVIIDIYKQSNIDILYGDTDYVGEKSNTIIPAHQIGKKYKILPYSLKWIWAQMIFGHPSSFVSLKTYKKYGLYDPSFKIAADYDFFIRIIQENIHAYYITKVISHFREGGISTSSEKELYKENFKARKKNNILIAYIVSAILNVLNIVKTKRQKT